MIHVDYEAAKSKIVFQENYAWREPLEDALETAEIYLGDDVRLGGLVVASVFVVSAICHALSELGDAITSSRETP